ncbi:MAG: 50S ribosomal protein L15 [Candidatus Xenobia bacterium]
MRGNDIKPAQGARHRRRRVGRGMTDGTFCGRGMNGQGARSGGGKGPGFEGGQTPWYRRLPKYRGFKNPFRTEFQVVNLVDLEARFEDGATVDAQALKERRLVSDLKAPVKVLGTGELKKKLTVTVDAVSAGAREAIEAAGGKVEVI